jgi:hypothetical protein
MRYRLDVQHYINDRLLEPGHIVGDGTDVAMVDANGEDIPPSQHMTPLDGEAQQVFKKRFPGARLPKQEALDRIPIHERDGLVQQPSGGVVDTVDGVPGGYVIGPDGKPTAELKKGLPDPGSPNNPVGRPVIGTPPTPGATAVVPPRPLADQGQPPGAPLRPGTAQAPVPAQTPGQVASQAPPAPPPMSNMKPTTTKK